MKNLPSPTCYLIGQSNLLIECAKLLLARHFTIKTIISPCSHVQTWAQNQKIDLACSLSDIDWEKNQADYLFSVVNNAVIPDNVLRKIRILGVNYHDAPLPRYAGSNATAWALLNNETSHGISWHVITNEIDGGDILKQVAIPIQPDETVLSLNMKCVEQAIAAFSELITDLPENRYHRIAQNHLERSYFARNQKPAGNGWINWHSRAEDLERLWRTTQWGDYRNPFTVLKIVIDNDVLTVNSLIVAQTCTHCLPGTVLEINQDHWKIGTVTNDVLIKNIHAASHETSEPGKLAAKYGIAAGTVLPSPTWQNQQQFQTFSEQCFPFEGTWVEQLTRFEPTPVTLNAQKVNLQVIPESLHTQCPELSENSTDRPLVLLAAWLIYLHRLEGQAQINVCVALSESALPKAICPLFSQYLPMSIAIDEQNNFAQILQQVRDNYLTVTQQKTYLNDIWQRYPELADVTPPEQHAYLIHLKTKHAEAETNTLPENFIYLCTQLLTRPRQSIATIDWVSDQQRQQLLLDWNDTDTPYPAQQTIHGLFEEQVKKTPDHAAIIAQNIQLSYLELNTRANQLAHYLIVQHAIRPDQLIAVYLERSHWMPIALLGILKSGAAYVPLDPAYPANRLIHILTESDTRVILTTQTLASQIRSLPDVNWEKVQLLVLDHADITATLMQQTVHNPVTATTSRHLAYVMYTSGTTGVPKGIQIEHQGIVNRITWMNRAYPLNPDDRVLQKTPYVFDVSVWELFWANWTGAAIVFAKPDGHKEPGYLSELIQSEKVSIIHFTPSMLNEFVHAMSVHKAQLSSLRHLFCSGEALSTTTFDKAQEWLPAVEIHNLYGPTEASIDVLFYDCKKQQPVYLGKPIDNIRVYVLDAQNRLLPAGVSGELHIAGDGLARGYLNQPALTTQRFIPNPLQTEQDRQNGRYDRLYKTGDLARWLPCGELDYLGRNDTQIKLRGFRIELREIEQVIQRLPEIQHSVVIVINNKLVAYYAARQALETARIQAYVATYLPEYMVPDQFIFLTELPLTISGKVDQKKLPAPALPSTGQIIKPGNATEENVALVLAAVLGSDLADISVTDDFFKLGGDSIVAIRFVSRLNEIFRKKIQVKDVLQLKTIRAISTLINETKPCTAQEESPYIPFSLINIEHYQQLLEKCQIEDIYPASTLQMGMLLDSSLNNKGTYHDVFHYEIALPFNQEKFLKLWERLADKHALLRAHFLPSERHSIDVVIFKEVKLHYRLFNDQPLLQLIEAERLNRFSPTEECLFHLLVNQHKENFDFIISFHHAIVDGWSMAELIAEFVQAYASDQSELDDSATQKMNAPLLSYGEFVRNEMRHLNDTKSISFWKNYLEEVEPAQATWKFDDTGTSPNSLYVYNFVLTPDEAEQANRLAQNIAISIDIVFLYAYLKTLSFFLNSDDITIGVAFSNRLEKKGGDTVFGLFPNVLPFRFQLDPKNTLMNELSETFATKIKLYEHKHIPYAHLKSAFNINLYEFAFSFIHFYKLKQIKPYVRKQQRFYRTGIPVVLEVMQMESFHFELKAHDDYVSQEYLNYFGNYLQLTLKNILQNKNEVSLTPDDFQKMAISWNETKRIFPKEKTLHQLFEEQVQRTPEAIALIFENKLLTYHQLNLRANQLANYLILNYQIKPDDLVVLCLDTDELLIISILAVIKAGAAYVPISPTYPEQRIAHILEDTQARLILTNSSHQQSIERLAHVESNGVLAVDDELITQQLKKQLTTNPITTVQSHHLAYVMYTSGTTGKPNGVMIEHKSVINLVNEISGKQNLQPNKRVALYSSCVFDASVHELFPALLSGCKLFMLPNEVRYDLQNLVDYYKKNAIQISYVPTVLANQFIKTCKSSQLELIYAAGDRLVLDAGIEIDRLGYQLVNQYGPTEATVSTTYKNVRRSGNGTINTNNIGQPLANYTCYVCSSDGCLVPMGAIGELWIGGIGVARGYLNNPDLTDQKFIHNPFQTDKEKNLGTNTVVYKSGDLVRWLPNGELEFIARNDTQIKIRGHRIELREIESVLMSYQEIKQCRVIPIPIKSAVDETKQDIYLVAYYVKGGAIQKDDELEFFTYWKSLYDYAYTNLEQEKYQENIQGWNSSYTGEPIPEIEMLEWRDEALTKIKKFNPERVLEIGSGSGLLLFGLLDQCQHYYATDISERAMRFTEKTANRLGLQSKITAIQCAADAIPYSQVIHCDTVILNSVIQYFPNLAYLEKLLIQIIDHIKVGHIFIGDVRDFRLLNCFHHSVLKYKKVPCSLNDVMYFSGREKELLISPEYFISLKSLHPQISSIELLPKFSKARNEMSCYRYDVILHVGQNNPAAKKIAVTKGIPVLDIQAYAEQRDQDYGVVKYPNQKIASDYFSYQLTCGQHCDLSQEDIDNLYTLDQIQEIFDKNGYQVTFHLDIADPLYLNVVFCKKDRIPEEEMDYETPENSALAKANNPLSNVKVNEDTFHDELLSYLRKYLPNYMIPNYFIGLEKFPLTANDKLDQSLLPKPIQSLGGEYFPPTNQTEATLRHIFSQILGLPEERIGIKDDFFNIGGNSLLVFRLLAKINDCFDCQIQPCHFFSNRTVGDLAQFITVLTPHLRTEKHVESIEK